MHLFPLCLHHALGASITRPNCANHVGILVNSSDVIKRCVDLWRAAQLQDVTLANLADQEIDHSLCGPHGSFKQVPVLAVSIPQFIILWHAVPAPCV